MVGALDSALKGSGSSPGRRVIGVVFLGRKTLNSHSASLHPGPEYKWVPGTHYMLYYMLGGGGVTCDGLASHPGGVEE